MLDLYGAKEYFDKYGFIYGDRTDGITHEIIKMNNIVDVENYLYMQNVIRFLYLELKRTKIFTSSK